MVTMTESEASQLEPRESEEFSMFTLIQRMSDKLDKKVQDINQRVDRSLSSIDQRVEEKLQNALEDIQQRVDDGIAATQSGRTAEKGKGKATPAPAPAPDSPGPELSET